MVSAAIKSGVDVGDRLDDLRAGRWEILEH